MTVTRPPRIHGRHLSVAGGLALLFAVAAAVGCLYTLAALVAVRAYGRRAPAPAVAPPLPSVTILKPLYGDEPLLEANLSSFCAQDYAGAVEIVFGVQRADDPAAAVARAVMAAHPRLACRLVVDERRHGQNGKIANLINMEPAIRHEIVVLADSDMVVGPDYLGQVVDALCAPGVGLVTCLYRGVALPALWSRLSAAGIDGHFLPNVLVGLAVKRARPCFGSTIGLRRATLARIGGFAAFRDVLADDNAMGEAVRALGLAVAVPARPVLGHVCTARTARALLRQDLRWSRTIRALDPAGFAGSIVTNPLPLATIALALGGFRPALLALLAATLACRLALQLGVRQFAGATAPVWLGPLRDLVTFAIFVASFWPASLEWRGHSFAVQADGTMAPPDQTG